MRKKKNAHTNKLGRLELDPAPLVIRVPKILLIHLNQICKERSQKTNYIRMAIAEKLHRSGHLNQVEIATLHTAGLLTGEMK